MKKTILGTLIVALLAGASVTFAAQTGDVNPNAAFSSTCLPLTSNLDIGAYDAVTGFQVSSLQFFLQAKGYLNSDPTGYFGLLTSAAVAKYQAAKGISPAAGYVGPVTRAMLNTEICPGLSAAATSNTSSNSGTTAPQQITLSNNGAFQVVAPNGGERWAIGTPHRVWWAPDTASTKAIAYLDRKVGSKFKYVGKLIPTSKSPYMWDGQIKRKGKYAEPGQYYIRIEDKKNDESDRSNAAFTLVDEGENEDSDVDHYAPIYVAPSAPAETQDTVTQTSSSAVTLTSPNGGQSYYNDQEVLVKFDAANLRNSTAVVSMLNSSGSVVRSTSAVASTRGGSAELKLTSSSVPAGQYTFRVCIKDPKVTSRTHCDTSDSSVTVSGRAVVAPTPTPTATPTPTPSAVPSPVALTKAIKVTSPNGGENYWAGESTIAVKYTASNMNGQFLKVYLNHATNGEVRVATGYSSSSGGEIKIPLTTGTKDAAGQYRVTVCAHGANTNGSDVCDSSNATFTISHRPTVTPTATPTPTPTYTPTPTPTYSY